MGFWEDLLRDILQIWSRAHVSSILFGDTMVPNIE